MSLATLLVALAALVLWVTLVCIGGITAGAIHLLFALGITLLIRWWALRV